MYLNIELVHVLHYMIEQVHQHLGFKTTNIKFSNEKEVCQKFNIVTKTFQSSPIYFSFRSRSNQETNKPTYLVALLGDTGETGALLLF